MSRKESLLRRFIEQKEETDKRSSEDTSPRGFVPRIL